MLLVSQESTDKFKNQLPVENNLLRRVGQKIFRVVEFTCNLENK